MAALIPVLLFRRVFGSLRYMAVRMVAPIMPTLQPKQLRPAVEKISLMQWALVSLVGILVFGVLFLFVAQVAVSPGPLVQQAHVATPYAPSVDSLESLSIRAHEGDASAMNAIGNRYHLGRGVRRDFSQAMNWYRKAADAGDTNAMENIGMLYESGQGVRTDERQARAWYEKAAEAGNEDAKLWLSEHFVN